MKMRILIAGVVSVVVLFAWSFVANAILGMRPSVTMHRPANEAEVYDVLSKNILSPNGYVVQSAANVQGPTTDPVFAVRNSGLTHADAGLTMVWHLMLWLIASLLVAELLSVTHQRILRSYPRKVLFVATCGLVIATLSELSQFDIGGLPLRSAGVLALSSFVGWVLAGLGMAKVIRQTD